MAIIETNFIGGGYSARSLNHNAQVCQNFYPVKATGKDSEVVALYNTPGLTSWGISQVEHEVRQLCVMDDYLYAVVYDRIYRFASSGAMTAMTGTLDTRSGNCWMETNGSQIMIVDGEAGYIFSGTNATKITDDDFPTPSSLTIQDQYFIVTKKDTAWFHISSYEDGTNWSGKDYGKAEQQPDNLVGCMSLSNELWLLGETSTEVWYNSGASAFTFQPINNAFIEVGCGAAGSVAKDEQSIFWLDDKFNVRRSLGFQARIISTDEVAYQINSYGTKSDAKGWTYVQEGHTFYELSFPTVGKKWVYDATTDVWHTRTTGLNDQRHRANCYAYFSGKHIVGDINNGTLYYYNLDAYEDYLWRSRSIRACVPLKTDRRRLTVNSFEIHFETGVGGEYGSTSDPQAILQYSKDGGHTWSNEKWTDIGTIGSHGTRAIWRRLGQSRNWVFRVIVSDAVKRVITGAYIDGELGD